MLIFEWLGGEYVACLINFISPPAYSRLARQQQQEKEKKKHKMMVSAKKRKKGTERNRAFSNVRMPSTVRIELRMNIPKKKLLYDETETTSYMIYVTFFFFL
jgi:hypothetical protein